MNLKDWRLQSVSTLAKGWTSPWTGQRFEKGASVILTSQVPIHSDKHLSIPVPNATAICLSISKRCWSCATEIRKQEGFDRKLAKSVHFSSAENAFNYLEYKVEAVVFAFTALESLANELIPDDFIYVRETSMKQERYDKKQMERWIPLDERLGKVIPVANGLDSPKGRHRGWDNFRKLKKLRDRLIHIKSEERRSSTPERETIWGKLTNIEPPHSQALSLIDYFFEQLDSKPRWYKEGRNRLKQ